MLTQTEEGRVRTYVYDLMNEAKEHGFKTDEPWKLMLVNEADKNAIRRDFYPAVADKVTPDNLLSVFHAVKIALRQSLSKEEVEMDLSNVLTNELRYIIAFNPKRPRK